MSQRIVNFSAGPATMPLPVLEQAQQDLVNYQGHGLSVMEMSHRSKPYDAIHQSAIQGVKTLLAVPDTHEGLFLQGGASHQFAMVPMNLLSAGGSADVIHSGSWTKKAIGELKKGYQYRVIASSESDGFLRLPTLSDADIDPTSTYTYMCSNNTIQ